MTREERFARMHNSPAPYFRLGDSLCRAFLEQAASEREFEGLKLLFPFVRECSVLGTSRGCKHLGEHMVLAFYSGHDLGRAHPELLEEVVPSNELRDAIRRVGMLQEYSGERFLNHGGLQLACGLIARGVFEGEPKEPVEGVFLRTIVNTLRAGFAAGTVARMDPVTCDFVGDLPPRIGNEIRNIVERVQISAPLKAIGQPVISLLDHPLIRLAREMYPAQPRELDAMLRFYDERLRALRVRSENDCPATELDLLDWIAAGLDYARRLKAENPEVVEAIVEEARGERLEGCARVVNRVVAEAGGIDPARLLGPLKAWQKRVYKWSEPDFYGQSLAQIAYFSDFAIWIAWVEQGS